MIRERTGFKIDRIPSWSVSHRTVSACGDRIGLWRHKPRLQGAQRLLLQRMTRSMVTREKVVVAFIGAIGRSVCLTKNQE